MILQGAKLTIQPLGVGYALLVEKQSSTGLHCTQYRKAPRQVLFFGPDPHRSSATVHSSTWALTSGRRERAVSLKGHFGTSGQPSSFSQSGIRAGPKLPFEAFPAGPTEFCRAHDAHVAGALNLYCQPPNILAQYSGNVRRGRCHCDCPCSGHPTTASPPWAPSDGRGCVAILIPALWLVHLLRRVMVLGGVAAQCAQKKCSEIASLYTKLSKQQFCPVRGPFRQCPLWGGKQHTISRLMFHISGHTWGQWLRLQR